VAEPIIIAVLVTYLVVMLAIGLWAGRESGDVAGYYVAGKKLPAWVIAFSSNATGESAWLLLGLTGMGYLVGMHAFWIVFGEVLGVTLAWAFIARPFKEYTDQYGSITVTDFLEDRFRDVSGTIRWLSAIIIFSMVAVYTAAQLTAAGKAFDSFLGLNYTTGVLLGTAVVLFYTAFGGFKAVAYTDLVQGVLMFAALFVLPVVGILVAGGWVPVMDMLRETDPALLRPMGEFGFTTAGVMSALSFAAVGLAFLGVPQLLVRFISARDTREISRGGLVAVICIIVFDCGAVLAGMSGRVLFPGLADAETILPTMASELFPAFITGIFLVVVLAAIMSTADSLLILASSAVVRDVLQKIYRPNMPERRLSFYGKATTVVVGLAAMVVALGEVRLIFWFVLFAWSGLASAFVPVILCGLYWKRTTREGAIAGMATGFVVTIAWVLLFKEHFHDLYEMIPGVAAGLAATILVSLATRPPEGAASEFDAVHATVGRAFKGPALMLALLAAPAALAAQDAPRARDLGIPFDGTPGPLNAITDVAGVEVGHSTIISGEGPLVVGEGPVRTGVTAVLPRGRGSHDPVFAAWFPLNGNGEMTGSTWIDEAGLLEGPVLITNTHSVGVARDAVIQWMLNNQADFRWALPVVAETYDGLLNDINGFHVRPEHVFESLDGARGGAVTEGAVGGGTGMVCNGFKGGIGTSSRRLADEAGGYTVGVLVQCNYGSQAGLRIAGAPVGRELLAQGIRGVCATAEPSPARSYLSGLPMCADIPDGSGDTAAMMPHHTAEYGSIIIVVATDAPLLPHQLERLVKRTTLGLGRQGSIASHFSGDIFVAFSTAARGLGAGSGEPIALSMLPGDRMDPLFRAAVEATEEAVTNAMVAARTMVGVDGVTVRALPHNAVTGILRRYNSLGQPR
jgi:sodium/proline symporter